MIPFQLQTVDTSVMSFIVKGSDVLTNDIVKNGQKLSIVSAQVSPAQRFRLLQMKICRFSQPIPSAQAIHSSIQLAMVTAGHRLQMSP